MRVFAVYNIKGGVGKTASAVSLAWLSSQGGARTILWDLDPQGAAGFTFRIKPGVAGGGKRLMKDSDAVLMSIKGTDFDNLDVLPSDFSYRNLDLVLDHAKKRRRRLARILEPLSSEYDNVFIDCAPGISLVSENVFAAADVLLVPTIPTVLSLRTLARLIKHLKASRRRPSLVLPFFCMVDRRKRLHRTVCAWARDHSRGFLDGSIPYASVVEQMGVRRKPLGAFSPSSEPARAYAALWEELLAKFDTEAPAAEAPSGKAVRSLLEDLGPHAPRRPDPAPSPEPPATPEPAPVPEAEPSPVPTSNSASNSGGRKKKKASRETTRKKARKKAAKPRKPRAGTAGPREVEFKIKVGGEQDFEAVTRALPEIRGVRSGEASEQVNHLFDTDDRTLHRAGCLLRLREEDGRFAITAKGPGDPTTDETLASRGEEEATVDAARARDILSGRLSPLAALRTRHGGDDSPLTRTLTEALGDRDLLHVGTFRNHRRRVGPVTLPVRGGELDVVFEMDRTEFPRGRVDHEIEVEIHDSDPERCRNALQELFARAGVAWRSAPSKASRFFRTLD